MWAAFGVLERPAEDYWAAHLPCHGAASPLRHSLELDIPRRMPERLICVSAIAMLLSAQTLKVLQRQAEDHYRP